MGNTPESKILKLEPTSIDFGNLSSGMGASAAINIKNCPSKISVHNDQLKASLITFANGDNTIEITLLPGTAGGLIWDELIIQKDSEEFRVPITARWIENTTEVTPRQSIEASTTSIKVPSQCFEEERTFKGKSCPLCNRNFPYNVVSGSWERCTCSWYQKIWNIGSYSYKELRYGVKEIPSYIKELWRIILDKEKW